MWRKQNPEIQRIINEHRKFDTKTNVKLYRYNYDADQSNFQFGM